MDINHDELRRELRDLDQEHREVMPKWRFRNFDLSLVHVKDRHIPRAMRLFKELAAKMVPVMFPTLPA